MAEINTSVVLKVDALHISLPSGGDRAHAVQNASFSISAGETLCIVGESGSGKSVMSLAVMGLLDKALKRESGSIQLLGEAIESVSDERLRQLRGSTMAMIFQEPMTALNPVMTCGAQVLELLFKHTKLSNSDAKAKVIEVFNRVKLPEPERIFSSYPHQLSGGQRQRIVIAMAVILKPKLLIADEPTTALDVTTQKEILSLLKELREEQGSAVLFITHDMGVVNDIADRVLVMNKGIVVEQGSKQQVLHAPQEDYTKMLLAAVPSMKPPPPRVLQSEVVQIKGEKVDKTYVSRTWTGRATNTHALIDATVAVRAGETVGVVGESGSGKSTFARCLIRLIDPTAGKIQWADHEVATLSESQLRKLRSHVQVVFQDPNRSLNPRRRIGDSMIEGAMNFGISEADARKESERLMDVVRLPRQSLNRFPSEFSGGQRQRLAIARALACKPKVLIADEAVSALDVSVQAEILKLLRSVQDELGLAILFITHDLRVAAQLCDRVIVMHQGRIVEQGPTAALYANPQQEYTKKLLTAAPGL
jgi:peptide/nickel transport system ATP-binding protein